VDGTASGGAGINGDPADEYRPAAELLSLEPGTRYAEGPSVALAARLCPGDGGEALLLEAEFPLDYAIEASLAEVRRALVEGAYGGFAQAWLLVALLYPGLYQDVGLGHDEHGGWRAVLVGEGFDPVGGADPDGAAPAGLAARHVGIVRVGPLE
jgi:hypothetical protein